MDSVTAIIDRIKPRTVLPFTPDEPNLALAREVATAMTRNDPFILENREDGHLFISTPAVVRETAGEKKNPFLRVSGKYVEANRPNNNGAMWTSDGLEVGLPTVANGPLNWLHEERHVIGCITTADLVKREAAVEELNDHIAVESVVWSWLWPRESAIIRSASEAGSLYYSMECISDTVTCIDCGGVSYEYERAMQAGPGVCQHVRNRKGRRRFDGPVFLGGAVVVPPHRPAWSASRAVVEAAIDEDSELGIAVNDVLVYSGART